MNKFLQLALAVSLFGGVSAVSHDAFAFVKAPALLKTVADVQESGIPADVEWLEVNVETPGSLGVEILYKVETLPDVKALKVTGSLNSADAVTLRNLTQIEYLDLSGASLTTIVESSFNGRTSLKGIILPENLETIGASAFQNTGLTTITVPASVKSMGTSCFHNNQVLKEATLLSSADIPESAFHTCPLLEKVDIKGEVKNITRYAFYECRGLKIINLPSSIVTIGDNAFYRTSSLEDIVLPKGITWIGNGNFFESGIKQIVLPPYAGIGTHLFRNCKSLEKVSLPESLYSLPEATFTECTSLKEVSCPTPIPPMVNTDYIYYQYVQFFNVNLAEVTLKVPDYALVNFKLDSNWMKFGKIEGTAPYSSIVLNQEFAFANNRRPEESGVNVNLEWGGKLSIGGSAPFNMNGLRFTYSPYARNQSPNTNYGQLINSSPAVTASNGTLSLYIEQDRWYFFSFPTDVKMSDLQHSVNSDFSVREYDGAVRAANGAGNSWKELSGDDTLSAGKGYIIRCKNTGWINVSLGEEACAKILDNSDRELTPSVFEAEDAANAGWNLLANPWTSHYDLSFSDLNTPLLIWNTANGGYTAYSLLDDKVVLEPGQAFFIQQAEEGTVKLPGAGRCFTTEGIAAEEKQETRGMDQRYLFDLTVESAEGSDRTRVVFNPDADMAYEIGRDAAKFFSDEALAPAIYTLDNAGNPLAINERPAGNREVQLMFSSKTEGTFNLSATHADGTVEIRDVVTGKVTPLPVDSKMEIRLPGNDEVCSRYVAILNEAATSGVDAVSGGESGLKIVAGVGVINVSGADEKVEVFTADGKLVAIAQGETTLTVTSGLYIVKAGEKSVKCIVR